MTDAEGSPADQVLAQDPSPGTELAPGSSVDLTVATGPGTTTSSTTSTTEP
ncbi:MAG: PASTA domain-containing protein [Thermoleophilia bacterium]